MCTAPLRAQIDAGRLTLVNGMDTESFGGIYVAGPSFFGPDYMGSMAVLMTEFGGDNPVIAARRTKVNLVKRFPLQRVLLKKCPQDAPVTDPVLVR